MKRFRRPKAFWPKIAGFQIPSSWFQSFNPAMILVLTPVLNATGVIVHTNLGRAPLSDAAMAAVQSAAGYVDVELDLTTGRRGPRIRV